MRARGPGSASSPWSSTTGLSGSCPGGWGSASRKAGRHESTRRTGSLDAEDSLAGQRRGCRFSRLFVLACCRWPGRNAPCAKPDYQHGMAWRELMLGCRACPSAMTGCLDLVRGLMTWWLVSARVRKGECLLRCRGEWRRTAQLREGFEDPLPRRGQERRLGRMRYPGLPAGPAGRPSWP